MVVNLAKCFLSTRQGHWCFQLPNADRNLLISLFLLNPPDFNSFQFIPVLFWSIPVSRPPIPGYSTSFRLNSVPFLRLETPPRICGLRSLHKARYYWYLLSFRLLAVPFWIVERGREIAKWKKPKPGANARRVPAGKGKERDCALSCNRRVQVTPPTIHWTHWKST